MATRAEARASAVERAATGHRGTLSRARGGLRRRYHGERSRGRGGSPSRPRETPGKKLRRLGTAPSSVGGGEAPVRCGLRDAGRADRARAALAGEEDRGAARGAGVRPEEAVPRGYSAEQPVRHGPNREQARSQRAPQGCRGCDADERVHRGARAEVHEQDRVRHLGVAQGGAQDLTVDVYQ